MVSYKWLYFPLLPVRSSGLRKVGIPSRTGKRSPETLTKASRCCSLTARKESPVKGLRSDATVCARSAHVRCCSGRKRAQMLSIKAPARHAWVKAPLRFQLCGRTKKLKGKTSHRPTSPQQTATKTAAPVRIFVARNSRFHIQTITAANQQVKNVRRLFPDAGPTSHAGFTSRTR